MFDGLNEGDIVSAAVVIKSINKNKSKSSPPKDYIKLIVNDGKNDVPAFMWDTNEINFVVGDTVKLKGKLGSYNNNPKLDVIDITKSDKVITIKLPSLDESEVKDYIERFNKLRALVEDEDFQTVLTSIFDNDSLWQMFIKAPAAKGNHQAYCGGLLEHTVGVVELCNMSYKQSPENVNLSLLITGAMLHDIGKIREYCYEQVIDRTTSGKLVGHTSLGLSIVCRLLPDDFPVKKSTELMHLILSHHGKRDWGAPVEPMMKEAIIIHACDLMDCYNSRFDQMKAKTNSEWSQFDDTFSRSWYLNSINEETGDREMAGR